MYITVNGSVAACWKTEKKSDQWSHDNSLMDIWNGSQFQNLRNDHYHGKWTERCRECLKEYHGGIDSLANAYDSFAPDSMPSLIELELSNICNLECIMCNGNLSSKIRQNREKRPALPQIYDDRFLDELEEFFPHLVELRINGGEPFAQKIVFDLLSRVPDDLRVVIATNGTIYNDKVSDLLTRKNIHLNVSVDSLRPDRYADIRIGGHLPTVIDNIHRFRKFEAMDICIMVNPMINNWDEMHEFSEWAQSMKCNIHYNTVLEPKYLSIKELPADEILEIIKGLNVPSTCHEFNDLVSKLKIWWENAK